MHFNQLSLTVNFFTSREFHVASSLTLKSSSKHVTGGKLRTKLLDVIKNRFFVHSTENIFHSIHQQIFSENIGKQREILGDIVSSEMKSFFCFSVEIKIIDFSSKTFLRRTIFFCLFQSAKNLTTSLFKLTFYKIAFYMPSTHD